MKEMFLICHLEEGWPPGCCALEWEEEWFAKDKCP